MFLNVFITYRGFIYGDVLYFKDGCSSLFDQLHFIFQVVFLRVQYLRDVLQKPHHGDFSFSSKLS